MQWRMSKPVRTEICVFDLDRDAVEVVFASPRLLEAPNWHPGGDWLLVNGEGRLWRVELDAGARELPPVESGPLSQLNNDHGFSPNGRYIAFSDRSETGFSCIYTLREGGEPSRITPEVPSYFHGWSPDGQTLAYCARREGAYIICTCPAKGGAERWLVEPVGHSDGPDYTPDGRWIWFNSSRGGSMDLWRVRPDGTAPTRMTDDERVNWFPHPSPDGRHVLYLAYPEGTEHHPRDLDVELRLLTAEGGEPRTLLRIFGGQGTINGPCWAPDGRSFAFARYHPATEPPERETPREPVAATP